MADKKVKLTPKQAKFVKEVAKGKTYTDAYKEAYDVAPTTKQKSIHEQASVTSSLPQVSNALENLFSLDKTKQIVENLHTLAISAEDEKIQVESTKVWLDRAIPKSEANTINNFGNIQVNHREKYDL
jgi:hypothetical protein